MTVLLVVGMMSLHWMAAIFVLVFIEKNWKYGRALSKASGGVLIGLGAVAVVSPGLFAIISR